jgi:hypothetical protein
MTLLLLLSTSCRYLRSAPFRLDWSSITKIHRNLPVDGRDASTPLRDVKHDAPSLMTASSQPLDEQAGRPRTPLSTSDETLPIIYRTPGEVGGISVR